MWNAKINLFTWKPEDKTLWTDEKRMKSIGISPRRIVRSNLPDLTIRSENTSHLFVHIENTDEAWIYRRGETSCPVETVKILKDR